jgi:hypothetical protein
MSVVQLVTPAADGTSVRTFEVTGGAGLHCSFCCGSGW